MDFEFQVFGSKSSQDIDAIVYVDSICDNPFYALEECKVFNKKIAEFLKTDKVVNSNLAIVESSIIKKVLKGTEDEVNNSLIRTYDLHQQYFPNKIRAFIPRDIDLKILRTGRVLLSLISRTEYRPVVKLALQKDFRERVKALYQCDISKLDASSLSSKNVAYEDFIKVYAFQIGQTLGLLEGEELYTKEEIISSYPELEPYIKRDVTQELKTLEKWKNIFLDRTKDMQLKSFIEYNFGEI
jgi:hypothetical protein